MRRFIAASAALIVALSLVAASVGTVSAVTKSAKLVWDNDEGYTWDPAKSVTITRGYGRLSDIDMNDKVSDIYVNLNSGECIAFWRDNYFTGTSFAVHGPKTNAYYNMRSTSLGRYASSVLFGKVVGGVCRDPWS